MRDGARWRVLGTGLLLFLVALPLATVGQQALVLAAGALLNASTGALEAWVLPHLPVDPVYAGAAARIVGGIEPRGLAVAGTAGAALHWLLPALFGAASDVAPGAIASALLAPGVTVAARAMAMLLATIALVAGVQQAARRVRDAAARICLRGVNLWLLLGLVHETTLDVRELEATGLPFAFAALSPVAADGQRALVTRSLETLPVQVVEVVTALLAVLVCLCAAWAVRTVPASLLLLARRRLRSTLAARWRTLRTLPAPAVRTTLAQAAAIVVLFTLAALSPVAVGATGQPSTVLDAATPLDDRSEAASVPVGLIGADIPAARVPTTPIAPPHADAAGGGAVAAADTDGASAARTQPARATAAGTPTPSSVVLAAASAASPVGAASLSASPAPGGPTVARRGSVVAVKGGNYQYTFLVNGAPTVIRGMGYNPWYADRPPDERRRLYARDFAAMREIGVNTIEGWFQNQFDEVTLDEAARQGIGVIVPFELNHDYDYSDPAVRAMFRQQITDWVLRYRDHPGVQMWGPGNEVMHRLIFPSAVQGQQDPARQQRADDFAAFYVEVVDLIHELDPHHPVVYRDAEDLYFARIREALLRDGKRRPWFVYGTNVYTQRLAEVIQDWPAQGLDAPLLVSEFSPGGVGAAERPRMLEWYWSAIRAHPERVIGGVVYTWATRGPEDLDRIFGLTDENGRPIDGSLAALRRLFGEETVGRGAHTGTGTVRRP